MSFSYLYFCYFRDYIFLFHLIIIMIFVIFFCETITCPLLNVYCFCFTIYVHAWKEKLNIWFFFLLIKVNNTFLQMFFCRNALCLWIIDFSALCWKTEETQHRQEQPFFNTFAISFISPSPRSRPRSRFLNSTKTTRPFLLSCYERVFLSSFPLISKNSRVLVIGQEIIHEGGWGKSKRKTESSPFRPHMWTHIFYDILEMNIFLCLLALFCCFLFPAAAGDDDDAVLWFIHWLVCIQIYEEIRVELMYMICSFTHSPPLWMLA